MFKFELGNKIYALKNIKVDNNNSKSVDDALKEVFMANLMSALKVGPKFSAIFAYDAILYKNNLQYAMELCRTVNDRETLAK